MKRFYFFLTCVCLLAGGFTATAQVFRNSDLEISQLEDHVWVIETTDKTSMYIIEGTDKAMLIDTGTKCEKLDEVVRTITKKPLYVLITHAHGDHAGNIQYFPEIYLHPADTVLLNKSYKGLIHFVKDGQVFDLGGKKIEVSHMPAHTPGSIVLLDRKAGSCYSGDAFGSGQVWLQLRPFATMKTYISSCKKMEKLMAEGITKIYCGHYPHVKKALTMDYLLPMRKLAESLDNGTDKSAIPFTTKVSIGCDNPMIATNGPARIVYDPEHIK
ncbi:MAG: MBL fold metallo-hydrolase [Bacteroidia bacterium]|nr:MBL fold metallo-hydrolase [Bacteroidia bacterium]